MWVINLKRECYHSIQCYHSTDVDIVKIKTRMYFLAYSVGFMATYAAHPPQ